MSESVDREARPGAVAAPAAVEPAALPSTASRALDLLARRREASVAFVALALFVFFSVSHDAFVTSANLRVVSQFTTPVALIAVAQVMNLVSAEIDLSLGHTFAFTPFIMLAAQDWGLPLAPAAVIALIGASLVGLVNGLITVITGVPSFITTLGMLFFLQGLTLTVSRGFPKAAPRGGLAQWFGGANFSGFWWAVGLAVVLHTVLTNTRWGVYTFATGGNPIGAREAGINIARIKVGNFMIAATLAGFAGIIEGIRVNSFLPLAGGADLMFLGVASAVIGGTALFGGVGTVIGAFLGALLLGILRDGLAIHGISAFTYFMILGSAVVAAMILNVVANRFRIRLRRT